MTQAGTVYVDVRADTTGFLADMRRGAAQAEVGLGRLGAAGGGAMAVIGRSAAAAAVGITALGAAGVVASTRFEKAISGVGAVANATAGELESLRQAALDAGAATAFSASEAAQAEAELAKAGVSTTDILGGGLRGALDLAAAGQLALADAATITAQALNTFGLNGDQTSRVADTLAAGANKSAADVGQLGQALQQSGLVAKQAGLSLEDTVGVLSLFAQNGLQASDAGTSLRTLLLRLAPTSKEAADQMAALGLSFFDAQGRFIGIQGVAQELQDSLAGLSDAQRQQALTTIFGSDAIRGATLLYQSGAEGVREYITAVNDQGAAQRVAAQQLDNLAGDLEKLRGSAETFLIGIGEGANDGLRSLVQATEGAVNDLGDIAESPAFSAIARNVGDFLGSVADGIGGIGSDIADALSGIDASEVDSFFADIRDAVDGLEGPIAGLGVALASLNLGKLPLIGSTLTNLIPGISPLTGILAGVVLQSDEARSALGDFFGAAGEGGGAVASVVGTLADAFGFLADQTWLVVPALDAFVAYKLVSTISPWIGSVTELGKSFVYLGQQVGSIAATQGVSKLQALGGVLRSSAQEAGGLSGALGSGGLSGAAIGASAAIGGGLFIYQQWRDNVDAVEQRTRSLTDALNEQADSTALAVIASQLNDLLTAPGNGGFLDTINAAKLSIPELSKVLEGSAGAFDDLSRRFDTFDTPRTQIDQLEASLRSLPDSIRPFVSGLIDLRDNGQLTAEQVALILRTLGELDAGSRLYAQGVAFQAQQFAEAAKGAELSARAQRDLSTALNNNAGIQERRDALQRLKEAYPELATAAGIAGKAVDDSGDAADKASRKLGLLGNFVSDLTNRFEGLGPSIGAGIARSLTSALAPAADSLNEVIDLFSSRSRLAEANDRVEEARKRAADIASGNTDGLVSARKGLADAQEALTDALEADADRLVAAEDRLVEANQRLEDAQAKGAAQASGGKAFLGFGEADLSIARDIERAQRDVAKAQRDVEDARRPSDSTLSAQERLNEAQAKYGDELAKTGPASREYRDALRDIEQAELDRVTAAEAVSEAMGKVTADDIPAAISALQGLEAQHLLTRDAVDAVTASLLREAAAAQALAGGSSVPIVRPATTTAARPSAIPAVQSLGPARPGAINAERENRAGTSTTGGGFFGSLTRPFREAIAEVTPPDQRDLGTFLRKFPTSPAQAESFTIGGQSFTWTGNAWVGGDKEKAFETWQRTGRRTGGPLGRRQLVELTEDGKPEAFTLGGRSYLATGNQTGNVTSYPELSGRNDELIAELRALRTFLAAAVNQRPNVAGNTVVINEATPERTYLEVNRALADATYGVR